MRILLNIGLSKSPTFNGVKEGEKFSREYVKGCCHSVAQVEVASIDFVECLTEHYAIVAFDYNGTAPFNMEKFYSSIYKLSKHLKQDCIAVWSPATQEGAVIGEYSRGYKFNPDSFMVKVG